MDATGRYTGDLTMGGRSERRATADVQTLFNMTLVKTRSPSVPRMELAVELMIRRRPRYALYVGPDGGAG